ncbi:MAG TPA: cytochrome c-type biogenesis protein [Acidimicrobiales bacterium]|nr:cytochrome c-type biogenesis protein [Acidimicrobiales bacterium]
MRLKLSYALMAIALATALFAGTRSEATPTAAQRALSLEQSIKCPVCRGQSVAESDSEASKAIRTEIERRIGAGQPDSEIRAYFAQTLGDDILLRPPASGWGGLVWVLPIAALVVASAGIGYAFWRWRRWST